MKIKTYVGCSGWAYQDWKDVFYPKDLSRNERLSYYTRFFNTLEINSTFYRLPTKKALQSWYDQTPNDFRFSLKASRYITHIKRFKDVREPLKKFYDLCDILGEKVGCFLFQLPSNMDFTIKTLENIVTQLDTTYTNIIEFRHRGWWNSHVIQAFKEAHIGFCTVSGFDLPQDVLIINKRAYVRFHGTPSYSSLYSNQDLSQWARRIKAHSLDELWVYFNNDHQAYAVQNALQFKEYFKTK